MNQPRYAETDAAECAELTRRHARTFSIASRFLPAEKRRAAFAVYAFCRIADDIVDEVSTITASRENAREALEQHRIGFIEALSGRPSGPLFRELSWAVRRYGIPAAPFHSLLNALRGDLATREIATWHELSRYCGGVASTVGEMCAYVFGVPSDADGRVQALRHARTLGVALQLTNILRDVGEDAARGRCYLPTADLRAFGIARGEVIDGTIVAKDERWRLLMRHEIARARSLYADAAPGLQMLDADSRTCATICSRGYAAILDAIEGRDFDSLGGRARVGSVRKAFIIVNAWRGARFSRSREDAAVVGTIGRDAPKSMSSR